MGDGAGDLTKEQRDQHIRRYAELLEKRRAEIPVQQNAAVEIGYGKPPPRPKGVARQVAEDTGLSVDTVRRALNPKPPAPRPEPTAIKMALEPESEHDAIIREANAIVSAPPRKIAKFPNTANKWPTWRRAEARMGEYTVGLVGESKYQRACKGMKPGEIVALIHEPDNKFDSDAVKCVDALGQTLGYVPREHWLQRVIAVEGKEVVARIQEVIGGGKGKSVGILLTVWTAGDMEKGLAAGRKVGCLGVLAIAFACATLAMLTTGFYPAKASTTAAAIAPAPVAAPTAPTPNAGASN